MAFTKEEALYKAAIANYEQLKAHCKEVHIEGNDSVANNLASGGATVKALAESSIVACDERLVQIKALGNKDGPKAFYDWLDFTGQDNRFFKRDYVGNAKEEIKPIPFRAELCECFKLFALGSAKI